MRLWFLRKNKSKHSYRLLNQSDPNLSTSISDNDLDINQENMPKLEISSMDFQSYEELVGSKKKVNYKKYGIIGGIVLVVIVVIVVVVVFVTQGNDEDNGDVTSQQALALEDFLEGRLLTNKNNATWISDTELMYKDQDDNIVKYNVATNQKSTIISSNNQLILETFEFSLSPDKKYLLIATSYERIFRHSSAALYHVIDLETTIFYPVNISGKHEHLLLAKWAPVGKGLVLVKDYNVYYKADISTTELQITHDGNRAFGYGVCDWVYEEEVFSSKEAVWFSPDGKKLAFIRFNDRDVEIMNFPVYGPPGDPLFQYPGSFGINYPKAGTRNPTVNLFYIDVSSLQQDDQITLTEMLVPQDLRNVDHIISAVTWQNNDSVISVWMNRVQNMAYVQSCSKEACTVFKTVFSTTGWVELSPLANSDGTQILVITSQEQGNDGGYRHITMISTANGTEIALTSGKYVVQQIIRWDQETNIIFYAANTETHSQYRNIYAVKAEAGQKSQCLTCELTHNGAASTYYSAQFSEKNVVVITEGPDTPRVDIYSWNIDDNQIHLKHAIEWEKNPAMHQLLSERATPDVIYQSIPLDSGFSAMVRLQLPPNIDMSGAVKYPMIVDVYAGPDSYAGNDRFDLSYGSYLVSNRSIIYAQINGRGSGLRGDRLMNAIYRKLGTVEIEDQIETAKKLSVRNKYIDPTRVAIWGWSYGGYASAMALAKDNNNVFQCAVSVAPVTDWTLYDSIYTERYMGLPTEDDNLAGYEASRLSTMHSALKGKKYFLIHGTLDDNVHYQQTMALSRDLELHDVLFTQMTYSDENHGLGSVRKHLYHSLGRFFGECLRMGKDL